MDSSEARVLWHHNVHIDLEEQLYFWRLAFYPTYRMGQVKTALHRILNDQGVKSAVAYELFGPHDLLLRVWLPRNSPFDRFQDHLIKELRPESLTMCDPFQVMQPLRHWLFDIGDDNRLTTPRGGEIKQVTSPEGLSLARSVEEGAADASTLRSLEAQHLVRVLPPSGDATTPDSSGTKLAVVVTGDARLTTEQQETFRDKLLQILDPDDDPGRIDQRSLYSGWGFGHFLILGRLRQPHPVYALTEDLLAPIYNDEVLRNFSARTYTHVSGSRAPVLLRESLVDVIPDTFEAGGDPRESRPRPVRQLAEPSRGLEVGDVFDGRYRIERVIGAGGFATVYAVLNIAEDEQQALKLFDSDASAVVRREIGVLRKIAHPNVMTVYSAGQAHDDGRWYMVSELIEGEPLSRYVGGDEQLSLDEAFDAADQLLAALIAIHPDDARIAQIRASHARDGQLSSEEFEELQQLQDAGFVHRDLKPRNIMRTSDGTIKLLDFNIASRAGDPVHTVSGTPPYQAPDGVNESWNVSTDLFAAGVVLYELICHQHPYENEMPQIGARPRDPRELRDDVPPAIAGFLTKACAPLSAERFASAEAMRYSLRAAREQPSTYLESRARLGGRLRDLRSDRSLSLQTLADRSGVDAVLLEQVEEGSGSPSLGEAQLLASALDVSLDDLIDG
jgi:serine/threonine protein kinase